MVLTGHHNTVLFVTHCGQNGMNEAVYHGVPIVAFPVFADQGDNARRIVDRGLGVTIDKNTITEEVVYSAIITVLNNTRQVTICSLLVIPVYCISGYVTILEIISLHILYVLTCGMS